MRKKPLLLGAAAGCLLATAVTADRVAATAAADRLATRLRCAVDLPSEPSVSFGGFPFLSQLAAGSFDSLRVTATDVPAGRFRVNVEATATGVHLPRGEALRTDSLTARITMGYDLLRTTLAKGVDPVPPPTTAPPPTPPSSSGTAASPPPAWPTGTASPPTSAPPAAGMPPGFAGDISADDSGRLLIETSRVVLGREVPVTVVAVPEITDGSLTVRPIEIELSAMGLRLPATRLPASRQPPRVDLPALPAGLRWSTATAVPDGLQLTVEGTDVTVPQRATADGGKCSGGAA